MGISINPKRFFLPSSPFYKYPQEISHWALCFFAPMTHVRGFERISLLCDHLAGLPDSPYRLIRQKSLQCVGQRCKALVVPGFNALVVPAGFNALICQHIAPLSTTPPTTKPSSLPLPLPKPLQLPSPSASLCCGLLLHQGLMTSSVSLLDSTHPTLVNSSHPTGLQHQT